VAVVEHVGLREALLRLLELAEGVARLARAEPRRAARTLAIVSVWSAGHTRCTRT
jgi:hypothetical protein